MISLKNFKEQTRKDDFVCLTFVIILFLFVAWMCSPPGNKFVQICFLGHNTRYNIEKIFKKDSVSEYMHYRNTAVYNAKMYPKSRQAIYDINKAIDLLPKYAPKSELKDLYYDRAEINLFLGYKKEALSDFLKAGRMNINDFYKIALLFKEIGKYKNSMIYCNNILLTDSSAYIGYSCMADLYSMINRPEIAINVWDLAEYRKVKTARVFYNRSELYRNLGNLKAANEDLKRAQTIDANVSQLAPISENVIHPKTLSLPIKPY